MAVRLADWVRGQEQRLAAAGIDNPALDVRVLAQEILGLDRLRLMMGGDRILTSGEIEALDGAIARRQRREPVARILGMREFWSLPFGLNEATLEPRPDSETLVDAALKAIKEKPHVFHEGRALRILDLGTGTGCLLLALLHELSNATGLGLDIAPRAVEQARLNAARLGLQDRAAFRVNDWLARLDATFDVIVANPPYIPSAEIAVLMPEVRDYDPVRALDGGADGLDVYRFLVPQWTQFLNPGGLAVCEVGIGQAAAVADLFRSSGFAAVAVHDDLGGVARCVSAFALP